MTDEDIIAWIQAALTASGKSQADLGRVLAVDRAQISRMLGKGLREGEKARKVSFQEILKIANALGVDLPAGGEPQHATNFVGVPVKGRIDERAWVSNSRGSLSSIRRVGGVFHPSYPLRDQSAYQIDSPGLPGENYQIDDYLITVPFRTYRPRPLRGDLVVIRTGRNGLVSYTLRRAVEEMDGIVLQPVLQGCADRTDPDGVLFALVIGSQRHHI